MFDLEAYLARSNARIASALLGFIESAGKTDRLADAMRYSLMAGGKRLRPNLCLAAAEAVGGEPERVMPLACALEMIHTYSLIHDDLPAMDDDDLRRGQPTCHVAFDEATAILAGDALLTLAFQVVAAMDEGRPELRLEAIRLIAAAAGHRGMVLGQMLDIQAEGRHLQRDEVEFLHARKTGDMIQAALVSGALIAGGTKESDRKTDGLRPGAGSGLPSGRRHLERRRRPGRDGQGRRHRPAATQELLPGADGA